MSVARSRRWGVEIESAVHSLCHVASLFVEFIALAECKLAGARDIGSIQRFGPL